MMEPSRRGRRLCLKIRSWFAVAIVASLLMLAACGDNNDDTTTDDTPEPDATQPADDTTDDEGAAGSEFFQSLAGDWTGTWTNTTFGSTGDITVGGTASDDGTGEATIDIGGQVFGLVDPDAQNVSATFDNDTLTIEVAGDPVFGDISITVTADGQMTMEATNIPNPDIDRMTAEGTATATQIDVTYTVHFADGSTAEGTATLSKS